MSLDATTDPQPGDATSPADPPKGDDAPPADKPGASLLGSEDGGGDTPPSSFVESLSEDHQKMARAKGWHEAGDVFKAFAEIEAWQGRIADQPRVPGDGAKPEEIAAFRKAIGVPEKPGDYLGDWKPAEGVAIDEARRDGFLQKMHDAGAPPQAVRIALDAYNDLGAAGNEGFEKRAAEAPEQTAEALRMDWGDGYQAKMDLANRGLRLVLGEAVPDFKQLQLADGSFVGDNELVVRAWATIGQALGGRPGLPGATAPNLPGAIGTAEQAQARIAEMQKDPEISKAATDVRHPRHKEVIEESTRLNKIITDAQLAGHTRGGAG